MQSITYKSPTGKEITFENAPPFVGWLYKGLGIPETLITQDRSTGQDGYTAYEVLLESRQITLTGHVHGDSGGEEGIEEMYRFKRKLMSVLNPKFGAGTLIYSNDAGEWKIPAICSNTQELDKIKEFQTLEILFECPDPYFRTIHPDIVNLAYIEGNLQFPLVTPGFFGTMGYEAKIDNDSDTYIPLEFEITGGSVNPTIKNDTTGESFTIEKPMDKSDVLYINTDSEHLEVSLIQTDDETNEKVRTNAFGLLKDGYDLIHLVPGVNVLNFYSDDDTKDVKIKIRYHKKYVGV